MTHGALARRRLITLAALGASAIAASPAEIRVEGEGLSFRVSSIGDRPSVGAGADVDNSLRLQGLAPSLSLGTSLGTSRRVELRWRDLRDEDVYATANPDLVLEGEQRVSWRSLDALFLQKLGKTPLRLEVGYRCLHLDRSWRDAVRLGSEGLATLDYSSQLSGHGLRTAIGLDVGFLRRLRLEGAVGLSMLRAQENLRSLRSGPGADAWVVPDRTFDGARTLTMLDSSIRLRVDVSSFFLAIGYRYYSWEKGADVPGEFDAYGPTYAVGLRLGG